MSMPIKTRYLAVIVLLAAAGCSPLLPTQRTGNAPPADGMPAKNLRPGVYCRIDMVVPPTASADAYHSFVGTVAQVTADDVVLTDAVEENCVDYGLRRAPSKRERGTVRVPLAGIDGIQIMAPPRPQPSGTSKSG
jgi:hypothetical protein